MAQLEAFPGEVRLNSLAHLPSLADLLGARAHAIVSARPLLEQPGGHACIGQGTVGVARRLIKIDAKPHRRVAQRDAPVAANIHDRGVKRL